MERRAGLGVLVLAIGLLAGCGGDGGGAASGSDAAGADLGPADATLEVLAEDITFPQDRYEVDGGVVEFTYENVGNVVHTLVITDVDGFKLTVSAKGDVDIGSVDLAPGTYDMFCDIPGHRVAGMEAELVVG